MVQNSLNITDLSFDNISQTAKKLPKRRNKYGFTTYQVVYPTVTPGNREGLIEEQGLEHDATDCEINDTIVASGDYDPLATWYIPLRDIEHTEQEIANIIEQTGVGVVSLSQPLDGVDKGLVLNGCGSDYLWHIVRAFILLGFYPPIDFCRLPKIAGQRNFGEVEACNATLEAVGDRLLTEIESNNQVCQEL